MESWLKVNRRAIALGMILPGLLAAAALAAMVWSLSVRRYGVSLLAAALAAAGLWMLAVLLRALVRPRIAYDRGEMIVDLGDRNPFHVPVHIVECFFLGQGPSALPKLHGREPETQNVVIRLAESAPEWKHRDVRPALGQWCEGYITIRGSWCEPITPGLMRRLNQRLAEVHREEEAAARRDPA